MKNRFCGGRARFIVILALCFLDAASLLAEPPARLPAPALAYGSLYNHPTLPLPRDEPSFTSTLVTLRSEGSPASVFGGRREGSSSNEAWEDRALVLCWHTFIGKEGISTDFSLADFGAQLDAIRELGYRFPTVEELLAGRIEGSMNVVVTIDDGHRTVPLALAKVLEPRGIVPTLFVYPSILGTTDFGMNDRVLATLAARGVPVGAHGYHHLFVTETLYKDDPKAFMDEIYKSKFKTEALSGEFVLAYAYPYGALSARTKVEVKKAGFAAGFAVKPGFVYASEALNDEYELPRLVVTHDNWKDILALLSRNAAGAGEAGTR